MKENTVIIKRVLNAPEHFVWAIWTQPEFIEQWFGTDMNGTVISAEVNLSLGGKYRISFRDSDGTRHTAFGEYTEIVNFSRLRFTWEWESEPGHVSEVTVYFEADAQKTVLTLEHSHLNLNSAHGYFEGWNSTIDKIVKRIIE